ncbi:hypothetical protein AB834_01310 [PVC group bacterium (ex Bugula neritina AB1)]|nr:hypothetical protein AB834_01310 [PVC group bacterium (ex Bugula neritina AB1)]
MKRKERDLVVQSNELIRAKTCLTKIQTKIVLKAISLIKKNECDLSRAYDIPIREFANEINYLSNSCVKELTEVAKGIVGKNIVIKRLEGSVLVTSWASDIEIFDDKISISFSEKLKPYLLELKRFFTSYDIKNILLLNSQTSIRLYQLLRQYLNLGVFEIDVDDLKEILGSKASKYGLFRQKILLPSQKDIHEKTDIFFSFSPIKTGRKVTGLRFKIKEKPKPTSTLKTVDEFTEKLFKEDEKQRALVEEERKTEGARTKRCYAYLNSLSETERLSITQAIDQMLGKDFELKMRTYFRKEGLFEDTNHEPETECRV